VANDGSNIVDSTATEIVGRLLEGNRRFADGEPQHGHQSAGWRAKLTAAQHPFATVLGCSDSRVPIELVFDQGLGDLFVVRVAGNVVEPYVVGSIEFAVDHLGTRVVLVLGHEDCGAVKAALAADSGGGAPAEVEKLLRAVRLCFDGLPSGLEPADRVSAAIEANVRRSVDRLLQVPDIARAANDGAVTVIGGIYDLDSGRVRILGD
jgi:carbonic anhydrase